MYRPLLLGLAAGVLACREGKPADLTDGDDTPTDGPIQTTPPTTDTPPTSPTTPPPDPCEVDAGLTLEVEHAQLRHSNELGVRVTASAEASVAVACTLRSDPSEVHLVEGTAPAERHELPIGGLLWEETYDCAAAAVCPATAEPVTFEVQTGPAPEGTPAIEITTASPDAGTEYVLLNAGLCWGNDQMLIVADRDGRIRWWHEAASGVGPSLEFRYHGDGRFAWGGGWGPNREGRPRTVDLFEGEVYDAAEAIPDVDDSRFHHDGKQLPDGRLLTLEEVPVDNFAGFRVRRVDPTTDEVDFDYHGQRAFDEGHLPWGFGDAWHANWADIVDEVLYVSLCNLSRTVAIDVATGDWLWTFGVDGDFALVDANGEPLGDDEFPQCQHGLELRGADDHLLVYDNGWDRGYTRVTEYALDPDAGVATLLWTWTEPDWFETTLGDVDWLPSGNVLVGACHSECISSNRGDRTTVIELDPVTGEKLWELKYPEVNRMAYRADTADACSLFANARYCGDTAARLETLGPVLAPGRSRW